MEIKRYKDIVWTDLPRIESPSTALVWARANLFDNPSVQHDLQGFADVLFEPSGATYGEAGWNAQTRGLLLEDIASGAVFVIQGLGLQPMLPLFRRTGGVGAGDQEWAIGDTAYLQPNIRNHAEIALRAALNSVGRLSGPPRVESTPQPRKKTEEKPKPLASVTVTHLYHDDEPVQGARFTAKLADGSVREGQTDPSGKAILTDIPPGRVRIRFEPDSRPYERVDQRDNPRLGQDIDSVISRYAGASEGGNS